MVVTGSRPGSRMGLNHGVPPLKPIPADNVGFTGTQEGLTRPQTTALKLELIQRGMWFTHGDCVGADEQAHVLATNVGYFIAVRPGTTDSKRAHCDGDIVHEPKPNLERNQDIVNDADVLLACPSNEEGEILRSGTWSTIRRARKKGIPIGIIRPSGRIEWERVKDG